MSKYNTKFKHMIVQHCLTGGRGAKSVAKAHSLTHGQVERWVAAYRQHGLAGLTKKYAAYDAPFKLKVLQHMQRDMLSLQQAAALYDIRSADQIRRWSHAYHEGGIEALMPRPKGRPKQMKPKPPPEPPVGDDARTLEQLRQENEYLRAEVAYLKKLDALIQAKRPVTPKKRK